MVLEGGATWESEQVVPLVEQSGMPKAWAWVVRKASERATRKAWQKAGMALETVLAQAHA